MEQERKNQLRSWAAFNDRAYEAYGTPIGIASRTEANRIADALGEFSEEDWGVIRLAQRGYIAEAQS